MLTLLLKNCLGVYFTEQPQRGKNLSPITCPVCGKITPVYIEHYDSDNLGQVAYVVREHPDAINEILKSTKFTLEEINKEGK